MALPNNTKTPRLRFPSSCSDITVTGCDTSAHTPIHMCIHTDVVMKLPTLKYLILWFCAVCYRASTLSRFLEKRRMTINVVLILQSFLVKIIDLSTNIVLSYGQQKSPIVPLYSP